MAFFYYIVSYEQGGLFAPKKNNSIELKIITDILKENDADVSLMNSREREFYTSLISSKIAAYLQGIKNTSEITSGILEGIVSSALDNDDPVPNDKQKYEQTAKLIYKCLIDYLGLKPDHDESSSNKATHS